MGETTSVRPQNGNTPDWYVSVATRFRNGTAHAFGLSGAINDYVLNSFAMKLETYLCMQFQLTRDVTCFYSTHEGVRFSDEIIPDIAKARKAGNLPPMRQVFAQLAGIAQKQSANSDPTLAAFRAATGQGGGTAEDLGTSPADVLPLIAKVLGKKNAKVAIIVEHVENVCPTGDIAVKGPGERNALAIMESFGHSTQYIESGNILIVVAPSASDVHPILRTASCRYFWVDIPLPNEAQRLNYATAVLGEKPQVTFESGMDIKEFAAITSGLAKFALEDIILASEETPSQQIKRAYVRERKAEIIKQEFMDVIEILDTDVTFDNVGGHALVKSYLFENVVDPIKDGDRDEVPTGILLIGPPGTGKTMLVSALGNATGFNVIKLNPEKIFSKFVGEAERNLAKLLEAAKALAPVYLFVDEIDQKVSRGDGGSQVFNNVFGMLLEFISKPSNRGNIVFIAATNKPETIDPALMRAGRFEIHIPMMPPDAKELDDVFVRIFSGYGLDFSKLPKRAEIIARCDNWTGAEVAKLARKAKRYTRRDGKSLGEEHILRALDMTRSRSQDYAGYIQNALACTEDLELLPDRYRAAAETAVKTETEPADTDWRRTRSVDGRQI
jgi:AAA+ superfamily predicted ATPase